MIFGIQPDVLIPFGFFGLFLFFQSKHHSSGSMSPGPGKTALGTSILIGGLCNVLFIIYFGYTNTLWYSLLLLALFIPFLAIGVILEKIVGKMWLATSGFIGWPVCAYFMFENAA